MPRNTIGHPVYEIELIDSDEALTNTQILALLNGKPGVSLCIRSGAGHEKRGGYFFHIENSPPNYRLKTFEGLTIDSLFIDKLVCFINHASGRAFCPEMLSYCQTYVNLRQD